ncbi:MAG: HypC/HybG/HupF family hydrogenase formation chaperone [Nanoarchaeota archaeon]
MCLAVPGKIVKITKDKAIVDYGIEKRTGKLINNEFKLNDYVIIQGGIVVTKVEKKEAEEALKLYKEAVN